MSFQDFSSTVIDVGGPSREDPSRAIAARIFQLNTSVKAFVRHVNSIGTSKDTVLFRQKLSVEVTSQLTRNLHAKKTGESECEHETRRQISQLSKDISAKLKVASEADNFSKDQANKTLGDGKLVKDFHAVLTEFQNAQRIEAEKQSILASLPIQDMDESGLDIDALEQQVLLNQQRRQEFLLLENEVVFNEAIIEEREQGIKEIQTQIGEVNEIFKDLAMLVHTQGVIIVEVMITVVNGIQLMREKLHVCALERTDEIDSNLGNASSATEQANVQLTKAETSKKSRSSLVCWLLVIFGSLLLVIIIIVVIRLL